MELNTTELKSIRDFTDKYSIPEVKAIKKLLNQAKVMEYQLHEITIRNRSLLRQLEPGQNEALLRLGKIFRTICTIRGHNWKEVMSPTRKREIVYTRYIFYKYTNTYTDYSLMKMGRIVHRDHSSVIHGLKVLEDICDTEPDFKATVQSVMAAAKKHLHKIL